MNKKKLILNCLLDPRSDFRSVKGISQETGIPKHEVESVLENSDQIRKCLVKSLWGEPIYTLRTNKIKWREILALIQEILAFKFT